MIILINTMLYLITIIIHDNHHHYCLTLTGIRSELERVDKPISTPDGRLTTGKDDRRMMMAVMMMKTIASTSLSLCLL